MLNKISEEIRNSLTFPDQDKILFNGKLIEINQANFSNLMEQTNKTIAFVDGGQAEIISTGTFCLSFVRIFAMVMQNNKKIGSYKNEFYLFTKAVYKDELIYQSKVFPLNEKIINEEDLLISSKDPTIKTGTERAPIQKVTNMARRFAELALTRNIQADFIVLDGTLQPTFKNEEKYFNNNLSALAKSSSLFTTSGNSPVVLLNKLGPKNSWSYLLDEQTYFVKLHPKAKHVFRFEGNQEVLTYLTQNSKDSLFLGYPYGLILADKFARISNQERNSLKTKFLLKKENREISSYLTTSNAHDILDNLS